MTFKQTLDEFYDWLVGNSVVSQSSARNYKSFVLRAVDDVLDPYFSKTFGMSPYANFVKTSATATRTQERSYVTALSEQAISDEIKKGVSNRKTMQDRSSGLRLFFEFMDSEGIFYDLIGWSTPKAKSLKNVALSASSAIVYTYTDLFKIFRSRLTTQDRAYNHMLYLARLMNKVFNNSNRKRNYDRILRSAIDGIKLLVDSNGNCISFANLSELDIIPGKSVQIKTNKGRAYTLYTDTANGIVPLQAVDISDLSIDHDVPLANLIDTLSAQTQYQYLYGLAKYYAAPAKDMFLRVNGIRNFGPKTQQCYSSYVNNLTVSPFVDGLHDDLKLLYNNNISFTIMLRSANSSKGKGKRTTGSITKKAATKTAATSPAKTAKTAQVSKTVPSSCVSIILHPGNISAFKNGLLKSKKAEVTLKYKDGRTDVKTWNANKFTPASDLMNNIRSHPWYRNGKANGLEQVELRIVP